MDGMIRALCLLAVAAGSLHAQKWRAQYFYDKAKSSLVITDLQFPSPTRGIAVGAILDGKSRKPVAVVTGDGGATWTQTPLEDAPISLFFLNDSLGWMLAGKNLWQTTEAGRDWRKVSKLPSPCLRVWFRDENHGIAACTNKSVLETADGGKKWTAIPESAKPDGMPEQSVYNWIMFPTPQYGLITGFNQPVRRWGPMFPTWLDPDEALNRREFPHQSYTLTTVDGGKTWKSATAALLGHVTRIRFAADGTGLGLIEYAESFKYPSEVYRIDWKTGKSETVFRDKRYAITDIWMAQDGTAYLAGVELEGSVRSVMPGPVRVFRSKDLKAWEQMPVDYRASAQHVIIAGGSELYLATDSGMILKLQ